jgi:hypothetical protein
MLLSANSNTMSMSTSVVVVGAIDAVESANVIVSTIEYTEEADTTQETIDRESDDDDWDKESDDDIHMNSDHQDDSDEECLLPGSTFAPEMLDREKLEVLVTAIDIRRQIHESELEVLAQLVRRFGKNISDMAEAVSERGCEITGSKYARCRRLIREVLAKTMDICAFLGFGYLNFLENDVLNYDIVLQVIVEESAGLLQEEGLSLILLEEASEIGSTLLLSALSKILSSVEL